MSMSNSGLFESLLGSKTAEAQGAPAGRIFGTRAGTRADFAAFLKAELKGRAVPSRAASVQDADFKADEAAGDSPEDRALAGPEIFDSALEPEAGPAGFEAPVPGLEEAARPWPAEAAFDLPPAAELAEAPLFESAAAPESGSGGRSPAGPEALAARAGGEFPGKPSVQAAAVADSGLTSDFEEYETLASSALGPTAPAPSGPAPSAPGARPAFSSAPTASAPTAPAPSASAPTAPRPAFSSAPMASAPTISASTASVPTVSASTAPEVLSAPAAARPEAPSPGRPGALGRPESFMEAAWTSVKYGASQAPETRPASTLAPSAGGDEESFSPFEVRPEAASSQPLDVFGPPAETAPRPGPSLRTGFEKLESSAAAAGLRLAPSGLAPSVLAPSVLASTVIAPAASARLAPTVPASTMPAPSALAPTVSAPSAGGGEALRPSGTGPYRAAAFERPGPAGSEVSALEAARSSLLNSASEEPPADGAAAPAPSGPRLAATLNQGRNIRPGDWPSLAGDLLVRGRLNLASGQVAAPAFAQSDDKAALTEALDKARLAWPAPFRKQVGLGLVALGRPGRSANSMTAGAALLGSSSPGEVLQNVLSGLKGELKVLKLPPRARDDLGRILAGSGLDQARLDRIMAGFGREGLSLETLNKNLAGLDLSGRSQGLIATEAGLTELARFLGSLGASAEVIDQALNSVKPGQPMTGEVLRDIFKRTEVGGLARNLGPGDIKSLAAFLREMGAGPQALDKLENQLGQTSGQMPLESFLDFLDGLKETPAEAVTGREMEKVKTLLEQVSRDDGLARPPVFNEILIKLRALGDTEIDDDFVNLSPALQALRGGISGAEDLADGQFQGQKENKENQERYRQAVQAMGTGQDGPAGASVMAEAEGYGGRSETLSRQIAQKIVFSRRRGLNRLKMNLNPAELGRLDIELSVKDGVLTASIRAENRAAYEALGDRVAELKKALAEGGVELAGLTLAHDDAESGHTFSAGLSELEKKAAQAWAAERPGEVHYLV